MKTNPQTGNTTPAEAARLLQEALIQRDARPKPCLDRFKEEYIRAIQQSNEYDDETPSITVDKMIRAVNNTNAPCDWLKYNPAMRTAANKIGIRTSKELREYIKKEVGQDD